MSLHKLWRCVYYLWFWKVTLPLVRSIYSLPQVAFVAIVVAYKDLLLDLYI